MIVSRFWPGRARAVILVVVLLLTVSIPGAVSAGGTSYVVKPGDTLGSIAAVYGIAMGAVMRANALSNAEMIWAGQKLTIPATGASSQSDAGNQANANADAAARTPDKVAAADSTASSAGQVSYKVKAGDTLGKIAARYGTTAEAIARTNHITRPDLIYAGMTLSIPATKQTSRSTPTKAKPSSTGSASQAPTGKATKLLVDISQQRCWLYSGSSVLFQWICSTGRPGSWTVPGTYRVQSKIPKAYGGNWNIWMPYWLGIYWAGNLENGIHGLPWNANGGAKLWQKKIGTPISFGCVVLDDKNAKRLYDMAYIGMPVVIQR